VNFMHVISRSTVAVVVTLATLIICHESRPESAALTLSTAMINAWNRLNVAFRTEAGGYRPGMFNDLH
jgi:hypothetical protein